MIRLEALQVLLKSLYKTQYHHNKKSFNIYIKTNFTLSNYLVDDVRSQALSSGPWLVENVQDNVVSLSINIHKVNIELNVHSSNNLSGNAVNSDGSKGRGGDFVGKAGFGTEFISGEIKEGFHFGVFQEGSGVLVNISTDLSLSADKSESEDDNDGFHF